MTPPVSAFRDVAAESLSPVHCRALTAALMACNGEHPIWTMVDLLGAFRSLRETFGARPPTLARLVGELEDSGRVSLAEWPVVLVQDSEPDDDTMSASAEEWLRRWLEVAELMTSLEAA